VERFYEDRSSLFVRAYDAFLDPPPPQIVGDVEFYQQLAGEAAAPTLELACGTGRIAVALAERGIEITGIDIAEGISNSQLQIELLITAGALVGDLSCFLQQQSRKLRVASLSLAGELQQQVHALLIVRQAGDHTSGIFNGLAVRFLCELQQFHLPQNRISGVPFEMIGGDGTGQVRVTLFDRR